MPNLNYPPAFPTLSGDILSISRFLKDPTFVARALRTIAEQMFVSNKLLTGQFFTQSGSVLYEQTEGLFADRAPKGVGPGAEYPLTTIGTGPAQTANTVKWGSDSEIPDESISRQNYDVVMRAFIKLANSMVQQIDSTALSAITSAIPGGNTTAAGKSWAGTAGAPNIVRDVALAVQNIVALKQGYQPNAVFVDLPTWAYAISDPTISLMLPRENPGVGNSPVLQGAGGDSMMKATRIGGMTWYTSPSIPVTGQATILDTTVFGAFVDETLQSEGYVGSPIDEGYMIQSKTMREEKTDAWRVRVRRTTVPIILEPSAAWTITGVDA